MPEYGPFNERELADKLVKIPEDEILEFHEQRMKKYRIFYIIALFLGIIGIVPIILGGLWRWVGFGVAIIGILIFTYGAFKRKRWIRILENLLYLKQKREKVLEITDEKKKSRPDKYDRIKKYRNKK